MAYVMARLELPDYDEWKQRFDGDPAGRVQAAEGHRLYRSVENPNEVIVQVEFESAEKAKSFREGLLASGAIDDLKLPAPPAVVEETEAVAY
jgi:hypothetical protein